MEYKVFRGIKYLLLTIFIYFSYKLFNRCLGTSISNKNPCRILLIW